MRYISSYSTSNTFEFIPCKHDHHMVAPDGSFRSMASGKLGPRPNNQCSDEFAADRDRATAESMLR